MDVSDINNVNSLCRDLSVRQDVQVSIKWNIFDFSLLRNPMAAIARSPTFTVRDAEWSLGIASNLMDVDHDTEFIIELFRRPSERNYYAEYEIEIHINKEVVFNSGRCAFSVERNKLCEHFFPEHDYLGSAVVIDDFSVSCILYLDKIPEEPYEKFFNDAVILGTDSKVNTEGTDAVDVLKMHKMSSTPYLSINRCPHGTLCITKTLVICINWTISDFQAFFRIVRGATARIPTLQMEDATLILEVSIDEQQRLCVQLLTERSQTKYHELKYQIAVDISSTALIFSGTVDRDGKQTLPPNGKVLQHFTLPDSIRTRANSSRPDKFACNVVCTVDVTISKISSEEILDDVHGEHSKDNKKGIDILSSHMKNLFLEGEDFDFVLKMKDKEFKVHKAILSARSPLLHEMLHDDTAKGNNAVDIVDYDPDVFEQFLLYLYTGQVGELSWENVMHLYALGAEYDLEHLREECVEFMECNMQIDTFSDTVSLAAKYNLSSLIERAEGFFVKNVEKIVLTPKWMVLMKENPVACNELYIKHATSKSK